MNNLTRPAWMEINLDDLVHNVKEIKAKLEGNTQILGIVKADAYETGAIQIVDTLIGEGVTYFGVATLSEALQIRKYHPAVDILVMGYTPEYLYSAAIDKNITLTLYTLAQAKTLNHQADLKGKATKIHLKIETGMNRLGFLPTDAHIEEMVQICRMNALSVEGIFTHFASAEADFDYTRAQMEKYDAVCNKLQAQDIHIPIQHVNNSAAIISFPEYNRDMVRAGVILYGIYPLPITKKDDLKLKHILSIKAQVSNVKEIEAGEKLSYGLTYTASKKTKIATIPVGYADGYSRDLSNKGYCIVHDTRVAIVGRICMDQMMLDVTGLPVEIGDEVILLGKSAHQEISIYEIAESIGQIPASIQCMLNKRFPRVYTKNGKVVKITDYLLNLSNEPINY